MNGAESLVRTLVKGGVEVCFANPGTSEMHFVGALDRVEGMRCVLGLFEGVCSGAADGYYRMTDKPASTLLHLGPGLANAAANLHNAKKAGSGIVNIVGEHALYHIKYDTPLTADIEGIARPFSHWVKTSPTSKTVAGDGAAGDPGRARGAGPDRHPDPAGRHRLGRGRGRCRNARHAGAGEALQRRRCRRRQGAEERQDGDAVHRRPGLARARPRARRQDRRQDRLPACRAPAAPRASSAAPAACRCCACISSSRRRRPS